MSAAGTWDEPPPLHTDNFTLSLVISLQLRNDAMLKYRLVRKEGS